jgi:hypothetical protein
VDELLSKIKKRAVTWASQISRKANAASKPKHIHVKSTVVESGDRVGIESTATSVKGDARAYEFGSGIHATSKKRSKWQQADGRILITPKKAKVLAFPWEKLSADPDETWYGGRKLIKKSATTGKAIFRFVEHPGVKPAGGGKGYLRPAIAEVRKSIRGELTKEMRDAYVGTIRKAFVKR